MKTHAVVKLMKPGKVIEIWYISLSPIRDVDFVLKLRYSQFDLLALILDLRVLYLFIAEA